MTDLTEIAGFYQNAFVRFDKERNAPPVVVEFYAYIGLRHTIRIRGGKVFVRLSDLTKNAPALVQQALAQILVAKILKRAVPRQANEIYQNFVRQPETAVDAGERRRARGRKMLTSARGQVYDLTEIFKAVNHDYFQNAVPQPQLSWSHQKTFRIFGHHDALHETVVISRTLDDARVPRFVVEFVLYHELLHIKHPTKIVNGRRRIHTTAFKRDEQKFLRCDEAEKWLETLARSQKQTVKSRKVKIKK